MMQNMQLLKKEVEAQPRQQVDWMARLKKGHMMSEWKVPLKTRGEDGGDILKMYVVVVDVVEGDSSRHMTVVT